MAIEEAFGELRKLQHLVTALKKRHDETAVVKYADQPILTEDIRKVDEIYLWFVKLKEEAIVQSG